MPSTRSGSARSKTTEESIASSDWSVNTPHESTSSTETNASIASRSTLTRRSPPSGAHGRQTLPRATTTMESLPAAPAPAAPAPAATALAAPAPAATAHAASTHASPAPATPALAAPSARADRSRAARKGRTTRQESGHPAPQNQEKRMALIMQRRNVPPSTDDSLLPLPTRQARDEDVGSTRSSHRKKAEVQARMALALRELEEAQARTKIAQVELELLAAEDSDGEDGIEEEVFERSEEVERWFVQTNEQPKEESEPVKTEDKRSMKEIARAMLKLSEKPRDTISSQNPELPYFNGNSEEWLAFKRSYEDSATSFSDAQNLTRLRRAIQGRTREAVQSLLFTANDPHEVIESLETRFGRPGAMALMELEKLKGLAKVSENPGDVCVFANKVRNAIETIKALGKPQYLCSPETLKVVVEKMPPVMKYRWFAYHESREDEGVQELVLVKDFLEKEAKMCGNYAPLEVLSEQRKVPRKPVHSVQEVPRERYKKSCPFCEEEHFPVECSKFKGAELDEKWNMIKKSRICFKCLRFKHSRVNCRAPVCKKCGRWHHTILHSDKSSIPPERESGREEKVASVHDARGEERAYLKIMPVDLFGPKGQVRVLALLDEGSTVTLLDSSIAEEIGAEGVRTTLTIETVGGKVMKKEGSQKINLKIKGAHGRIKRSITARTIDDLRLSEQVISKKTIRNCQHLKKIQDQLLYASERPKLLIGQDNWGLIVTRRLKKGKPSEPVASLTGLGWVLHGCESGSNSVVNFTHYSRSANDKEDIEEVIRDYFQLESLGIQNQLPTNDSDRRALEILESTTKKLPTGEYETGLLWKTEGEALPNNYNQAFRRLLSIEKKLDRNEELKTCYEKHMQNLVEKGYAEKAPATSPKGRTFYLPHFAVEHPVKKKTRIVFDAAAKFEGKSLNDALLTGPDLLQSLFGVLLRFREGPIAVMADIQDMFLRIKIKKEDRDSLRFLWRGNRRDGKPEELRMTSVTFGAASSPATAIHVMNKNAEGHAEAHPEAVKAINRNHYMDDYLQSFSTTAEAREISTQVRKIHEEANFQLKGWASNDPNVLIEIEDANKEESLELTKEAKTLGLRWLVLEDTLAFALGLKKTPKEILEGSRTPTKREVTSAVMSTFDPIGFATPVLIQGKKLIQDIWRSKIDWDEAINERQKLCWLKYLEEIEALTQLRIPRCISPYGGKGQLHTFTDASEEAYAAVVYWRTIGPGGEVHISMIAGKARVTPTKPVSIPRLELQAALLGSRLAATIKEEMQLEVVKKTYWTDSSTVLQWIKAEPRRFKTFVANRLAEIEEKTEPNDWRWVPTRENPADDATRGTPAEFSFNARWFQGPAFLRRPEEEWPFRNFKPEADMPEERINSRVLMTTTTKENLIDPGRFSSWERLLRVTARVIAFAHNLLRKVRKVVNVVARPKDEAWRLQKKARKKSQVPSRPANKEKRERPYVPLEEEHLRKAEEMLVTTSQRESFPADAKLLAEGKPLENSSRLKKIDVYVGNDGIIKLRSRTMKFHDDTGRKMNPIVLHGKQRITRLIVEHYHKKFLHANTATVMNEIRQKYWILGLRATIKAIARNCQWCRIRKSAPEVPPTGDLLDERLKHHQFPFSHAAVDCFGPMQVAVGRRVEKRWGALFTCLTTRAVHLELVPSLSTSSMIMALRRLAARRGTPKVMFSDNGTNFVGANRELQEAAQEKGIKWKFIPPGCPNMGGAWERLVRSVKTALTAVLNERTPPEEVLQTLLVEVEHIINSRPLTPVSTDPTDEESLTPNHFLLGRSCGAMAPGEFNEKDLIGKANWRTSQRLADHFWQRWVKEYLPLLMPRRVQGNGTNDPKEGDIVLITDHTLPRNSWPRGEVVKTYPGPDGKVRVLDVRTSGGVLRRATRRVVVLFPASSSRPEEAVLRTVGENVSDE